MWAGKKGHAGQDGGALHLYSDETKPRLVGNLPSRSAFTPRKDRKQTWNAGCLFLGAVWVMHAGGVLPHDYTITPF